MKIDIKNTNHQPLTQMQIDYVHELYKRAYSHCVHYVNQGKFKKSEDKTHDRS